MTSGNGKSFFLCGRGAVVASAAAAVVLLWSVAAAAQESQAPAQASPPSQDAPQKETTRPYEPGMLESVGRWFKDSIDRVNSNIKGARGTLGDLGEGASGAAKEAAGMAKDAAQSAADAAKSAASAVARLPASRLVNGRERCVLAPNGAPDCNAAAVAVCRSKGFASGSSLDIQSAQKCPARVWLSGRSAESGECEVETFVTRAMCQ